MANDGSPTAAELIASLTQGGTQPLSVEGLKHMTTFVKLTNASRESSRKDWIDVGRQALGLISAAGLVALFFYYCPETKRYDLIEKLVPAVLGLLGGYGIAKAKRD